MKKLYIIILVIVAATMAMYWWWTKSNDEMLSETASEEQINKDLGTVEVNSLEAEFNQIDQDLNGL